MPSFTYNLDVPDAPNDPSVDQPDMKVNTNSINGIIGVDHFTFESVGALDGYHQQTTLIAGSDAATPTGAVTGYSKTVTQPEMFWRAQNNGTVIQMSNFQFGVNSTYGPTNPPTIYNTGYDFLPGGMIMQWGFVNNAGSAWSNGSKSFSFPKVFPNNCFLVQINPVKNSTSFQCIAYLQGQPSTSSFNFTVLNGPLDFITYIAIGN